MDEHEVRDRVLRQRLERVFGFDRLRGGGRADDQERQDKEEGRKEKERKRLRELLLPSRRRKMEAESIEMSAKAKDTEVGLTGRYSNWFAPPPPYAPSTPATSSTSSSAIATTILADEEPNYGLGKTKIISMASPTTPTSLRDQSLGKGPRPPLRPSPREKIDTEREVQRDSHGLRELWPAFGQQQGGSSALREEHRYI
jgi:hypothetical protein